MFLHRGPSYQPKFIVVSMIEYSIVGPETSFEVMGNFAFTYLAVGALTGYKAARTEETLQTVRNGNKWEVASIASL